MNNPVRKHKKNPIFWITTAGIFGIILWLIIFHNKNHNLSNDPSIEEPIGIKQRKVYTGAEVEQISELLNSAPQVFPELRLKTSTQPGIYEYDLWVDHIDSGYVFLKAFKINDDQPLSELTLKKNSTIRLQNRINSITRISSEPFTIHEGDWGDYYAVRFEVWFKSYLSDNERLLTEKKYKIEGWSR